MPIAACWKVARYRASSSRYSMTGPSTGRRSLFIHRLRPSANNALVPKLPDVPGGVCQEKSDTAEKEAPHRDDTATFTRTAYVRACRGHDSSSGGLPPD